MAVSSHFSFVLSIMQSLAPSTPAERTNLPGSGGQSNEQQAAG
jgi:hypothetical protein